MLRRKRFVVLLNGYREPPHSRCIWSFAARDLEDAAAIVERHGMPVPVPGRNVMRVVPESEVPKEERRVSKWKT